jgi:uncharacterized protein
MQAEHGRILPIIARDAISDAVNAPRATDVFDETAPWLTEPGASFVTLMQDGELRGCIGTVQAHQSLLADIKRNAISAAMHDPRFQPLTRNELATVRIEVSLLSTPQPFDFSDEKDALAKIRPGIDGVVFEYGPYRSTFLPQVWESLVQPQQFLAALKLKAGLPGDFWAEDVKLSSYTVSKWRETELT